MFLEVDFPRGEAKEIANGVHNPKFPTSRLPSIPIFRQIGFPLSFISNTALTSTNDIRQMCRQAKYSALPTHPYGYTPWMVLEIQILTTRSSHATADTQSAPQFKLNFIRVLKQIICLWAQEDFKFRTAEKFPRM